VRWIVAASACALATCATPDGPPARGPSVATDPGHRAETAVITTPASASAPAPAVVVATGPERWLKGSTHVHARPSGDSSEPIPDVIRWYESRGYDFIFLTDHNRVSELDRDAGTEGSPFLRAPDDGLIVFAGVELTHNPSGCTPQRHPSDKCRIHVNVLGPTSRPPGKLAWTPRSTRDRREKYLAALAQQQQLGGIAQLNHPSWFWGITDELLAELAGHGMRLVEIANIQFEDWNAGDADHPSLEEIWDRALMRGATVWGVASDDAHDYSGRADAKWPAGGAWIVVKARRDPAAILAALADGRFYASTGVTLERAELEGDALVVEVAASDAAAGAVTIELVENGRRVARVQGPRARREVPASGYLRAVVTRADGARAWVQPVRRATTTPRDP